MLPEHDPYAMPMRPPFTSGSSLSPAWVSACSVALRAMIETGLIVRMTLRVYSGGFSKCEGAQRQLCSPLYPRRSCEASTQLRGVLRRSNASPIELPSELTMPYPVTTTRRIRTYLR